MKKILFLLLLPLLSFGQGVDIDAKLRAKDSQGRGLISPAQKGKIDAIDTANLFTAAKLPGTAFRTSYVQNIGNNKFNYAASDVAEYKYLTSGGVETTSGASHLCVTGMIPIPPGVIVCVNKQGSGGAFHCFYDASRTFISGSGIAAATTGGKQSVVAPTNAYYVRLCFTIPNAQALSAAQVMVSFGKPLPYEAYTTVARIRPVQLDNSLFLTETAGTNKFNPVDSVLTQSYLLVNGTTGALGGGTTGFVTGYIPVTAGLAYTINKVGVGGSYNCFYTAAKTLITSPAPTAAATTGGKQTVSAPSNAAFVRFSFVVTLGQSLTAAQVQVNEGSTALPYEDFSVSTKLKSTATGSGSLTDGAVTTNTIGAYAVTWEKLGPEVQAQLYKPSLVLPTKVYAVIGDTLQLYYKSFVRSLQQYFLKTDCAKGRAYPRYFEYAPTVSDTGTTNLIFTLYDVAGNVLDTKTVILRTKAAANPTTAKTVLGVGDSNFQNGEIMGELSRRMKGTSTSTDATSPTALSLTNWNFKGRLHNTANTVGWEGTGGWSWGNYITSGSAAIRFGVTGASNLNIGDIYRIPRTVNTQGAVNYWQFQIAEINVTAGTGNVRAIFYATPYHSDFASEPSTGTWTKQSGSGQSSVSYTSLAVENYQPFWNNTTGQIDFTTYVNTYCDGALNYLIAKNGVNDIIGIMPWADVTSIINNAKTFINALHTQYPNCKILIDSGILPSQNGGIGYNYNTSSAAGQYGEFGFNLKTWALIDAYIALCADPTYSSYVDLIPSYMQVDSDNVYPTVQKKINVRLPIYVSQGSNGVHTANVGYYQISDSYYRYLNCQ